MDETVDLNHSLLVIVPTYNEVDNVIPLVEEVLQRLPQAHVLFVDDNSTDGTFLKIKDLQIRFPTQVFLIQRPGKLGLASAYVAGFRWALERSYEWVCEMDADLSHRPVDLVKLVENFPTSDVIVGSRYITGGGTINWNIWRQIISRFGSFYARLILRMKINDFTGGFNAWNRKALSTIGIDSIFCEGYSFQIELKYRAKLAGLKILEVPIIFEERRAGASKMSGGIVVEAMYKIWFLAMKRRTILKTIHSK